MTGRTARKYWAPAERNGERRLTPTEWRMILRAAKASRQAYVAGFGPRDVADAAVRELPDGDWFVWMMARALFAGLAAKKEPWTLSVSSRDFDRALAYRGDLSRLHLERKGRTRPTSQVSPSHRPVQFHRHPVSTGPKRDPLPVEAARAAPIDVVMEREGIELQRVGKELSGVCPFHNDHSPSLRVSPAKGLWHCFPCGARGDVISFVMQLKGLDFPAAVRELAA